MKHNGEQQGARRPEDAAGEARGTRALVAVGGGVTGEQVELWQEWSERHLLLAARPLDGGGRLPQTRTVLQGVRDGFRQGKHRPLIGLLARWWPGELVFEWPFGFRPWSSGRRRARNWSVGR